MKAIRQETAAYRLESERSNGLWYTLTRKSDGATGFFQGDDADLWDRNMDAVERCNADNEQRLNETFDCLCSGYDDILTVGEG